MVMDDVVDVVVDRRGYGDNGGDNYCWILVSTNRDNEFISLYFGVHVSFMASAYLLMLENKVRSINGQP